MRADNTAHLITAAGRRHELARSKAIQAIRELDKASVPVTFETRRPHSRGLPIVALYPARHPSRGPTATRSKPPRARHASASSPPQHRRISTAPAASRQRPQPRLN